MGYYYFPLEKRNVRDFASSCKYIIMSEPNKPVPENGMKRTTAEQNKKYKEDIKKYEECISALESGHVNLYNNKIRTNCTDDFAVRMLFDGIPEYNRVFYIEPLQSEQDAYRKYYVSEFRVEKEIKTTDELLENIVEHYDYFNLEDKIFYNGTLGNPGYKEKAFEILDKLNKMTKSKHYLCDMIHPFDGGYSFDPAKVTSFYDLKKAHDYAKELINTGIVQLHDISNSYLGRFIERLLRLKWFDFALEVINHVVGNDEIVNEIKKNQFIKPLLSEMTDDSNAKEILKLLGMTSNVLTLIVEEDYDDGYSTREVKRKEFSDTGELRSYLIIEYKMPFEMASKDIDDLYWGDYTFNVEQKENN